MEGAVQVGQRKSLGLLNCLTPPLGTNKATTAAQSPFPLRYIFVLPSGVSSTVISPAGAAV